MSSNTVFITGGAGFIGRWLVARCLREGLKVVVYDNLSTGRLANIASFHDRIEFVQADILDSQSLNAAIERGRPKIAFHLAAYHFIPYCNEHPAETLRVNAEGTFTVLSAAAANQVETVVLASTGAAYVSKEAPLSEEREIPTPGDVYGLSKYLCEQIAEFVATTTSLNCRVARLFNTYGPYETNPHLIAHIMRSLHDGMRVELGNLHTKRDYIYVEDVANMLFSYAKATTTLRFTIANVGTGFEYSAAEIVSLISTLLGAEVKIVSSANRARSIDKLHQIADTTKLAELTGCRAQHSMEDGLRKLLVYEGLL